MAFCSNCGEKLKDGAKFCYGCGVPVNNKSQNNGDRKQEYSGKIVKCTRCGEVLKSFEPVCPTCGYEIRGSKATDSVKEFEYKFERANSIDKKIDLIRTFALPNTREDIQEFMILAISNIDSDSYDFSEGKTGDIRLSNAWMSKFEQAYEKAKLLFTDSSKFDEFYNTYKQKKKSVKSAKRSRKTSRFFSKNKELLLLVGFIVVSILLLSLGGLFHVFKVWQLEELSNQVEHSIAIGDYDTARIKANQIVDDVNWSEDSVKKWDEIRKSLLEMIDAKQAIAEGKINIGTTSKDLIGQDYKTVSEKLTKQGFTNIQEVANKDLIIGWIKSDGEVKEVSIDGKTDFTAKSNYAADVKIIITYHSFK